MRHQKAAVNKKDLLFFLIISLYRAGEHSSFLKVCSLMDDGLTSASPSDFGLFSVISFIFILIHNLVSTLLYPENSFFCLPGMVIYSVCWTFGSQMYISLFLFSLHPSLHRIAAPLGSLRSGCFPVRYNVYADVFPDTFINPHYFFFFFFCSHFPVRLLFFFSTPCLINLVHVHWVGSG